MDSPPSPVIEYDDIVSIPLWRRTVAIRRREIPRERMNEPMPINRKDLLGLRGLSREELQIIFDTADDNRRLLDTDNKKKNTLSGKTMLNVFYENSTRTRMSFELAGKCLGATVANMTSSGSSVSKGENLVDTAKNLDAMAADAIVIRHQSSGVPHLLAQHCKAAIINAGDGMHEHPTQALLDMYTMLQKKGSLEGLRVAIVGDVEHSRVACSNLLGLNTMGARVVIAAPTTLLPRDIQKLDCEVTWDMKAAVREADVVMALRIQMERQQSGLFPSVNEYAKHFGVDDELLSYARPDALIMHPGPINRGVELMSDTADGEHSVILDQVTNGVAIRMGVLELFCGVR